MPTFFCRHCRFKYAPRSQRKDPPEICGNCGGRGTVALEPDADSILKEADAI